MEKKEVNIVLGHIGNVSCKGDITQFICQKYLDNGKKPLVIKYSGGPNFFNEAESEGKKRNLAYFGGGTFLNIPTLLTSECYINPAQFVEEYLKNGKPVFNYQFNTRIITPYDTVYQNMFMEHGKTWLEGVYAVKERYENNDPSIFSRNPEAYIGSVERYYGYRTGWDEKFMEASKTGIEEFVSSMEKMLEARKNGILVMEELYDTLVFEGPYGGLMDDIDFGLYQTCLPYETGLYSLKKYFGKEYDTTITLCYDIHSLDLNKTVSNTLHSSLERHCIDRYAQGENNCKFAFVFRIHEKQNNESLVFRECFAKWLIETYKKALGIFDMSFDFIADENGNCKYVIAKEY